MKKTLLTGLLATLASSIPISSAAKNKILMQCVDHPAQWSQQHGYPDNKASKKDKVILKKYLIKIEDLWENLNNVLQLADSTKQAETYKNWQEQYKKLEKELVKETQQGEADYFNTDMEYCSLVLYDTLLKQPFYVKYLGTKNGIKTKQLIENQFNVLRSSLGK